MKRSTKIRIGHREGPVPSTLPRCRCRPRPSLTLPESSARPVLIATRPDDKDAKLDLEAGI